MFLANAAIVPIRDDDDVPVRKKLARAVRHGPPAMRAARVARRDEAVLPKTIDVLSPFHYVHRFGPPALCESVKVVKDAPDIFQPPAPSSCLVGPTLAKRLAHIPHDLEQQVRPVAKMMRDVTIPPATKHHSASIQPKRLAIHGSLVEKTKPAGPRVSVSETAPFDPLRRLLLLDAVAEFR